MRRIASDNHSTQARRHWERLLPINTSLAETACWKRCVPRDDFHSFHVVAHSDMSDSSDRRTTAWACDRRTHDAPLAYARCAVDCMDGANVSEAVESAVANLLGQSAPLTIFTLPARKTFGEKLLTRPIRRALRAEI